MTDARTAEVVPDANERGWEPFTCPGCGSAEVYVLCSISDGWEVAAVECLDCDWGQEYRAGEPAS